MPQLPLGSAEFSGLEGFDALRETLWNQPVPVRLDAPQSAVADFVLRSRSSQCGPMELLQFATTSLECVRSASAIRRGDADLYGLYVQFEGGTFIERDDQRESLGPGEMALVDLGRPFADVHASVDVSRMLVTFPHDALGLSPDRIASGLAGRALPVAHGVGPLLVPLLCAMNEHADALSPGDAEQAARNSLDLLSVFLSEALDDATGRHDATRRSLVLRATAYVRRHLADPDLSPSVIAAVHHVSVRSLQKLFADQGLTVAGVIRRERLEQCRRRLEDPAHAESSITEIAYRAGFRDSAHFSRAFKAAYGTSPREHRIVAAVRTNA
ncbi:helix-turn-helix domain-containing protein [Thermomonospora umbrina]|uniref:AraC-like DNA-binding protein n=1 Tax=Thermomonospora umbrina TaxID=111806 RepID=A0A3D9SSH7_9ACTN|nr:helix-turn-helix domain-containing protein [Thermomonospora umbrina]REE98748.1 AraC-like DNA-binding protein [Thermomonospora umbrina]